MDKVDARKLSREELLEKRKEVIRLFNKGTPVMTIARECGLSWPAVNAAIKLYSAGGKSALEPDQRGRKQGKGRVLSEDQETSLRHIIYKKRPWQMKIKVSGFLWNRDAIMQLIEQQCGISLTDRGVAKYLQRWGFPLLKQSQRPLLRCTREIQEWLQEHYANLCSQQLAGTADIYWVSKRPMVSNNGPESRWSKKLAMISAIDHHGKEYWLMVKGNFTQEKQIIFLKTLTRGSRRKVIVIRNNSDHFTDRSMTYWLDESKGKIEVHPPLLPKEIRKKKDALRRAAKLAKELELERRKKRKAVSLKRKP